MTVETAPAPAPMEAPAQRPRIFSGIQPSGTVHLGNDLGAIRNYVTLQWEYEAVYCIVDYHALTSTHESDVLRERTTEMAASLLALGLSREIVRAFNARYGPTFPEPQAVFTEAPVVLGTDGVKKMSKSLGNTIDIFAEPAAIRKQVMSMVTDTKRILRTDPGRPEVCNVCQLHRSFGDDYEEIWDGERTARTGCVDTKTLLADRIIAHYAPARERYLELMAHPAEVAGILEAGADRLRPMAAATMDEVRRKMGLR